jgi:hypothetical protein
MLTLSRVPADTSGPVLSWDDSVSTPPNAPVVRFSQKTHRFRSRLVRIPHAVTFQNRSIHAGVTQSGGIRACLMTTASY